MFTSPVPSRWSVRMRGVLFDILVTLLVVVAFTVGLVLTVLIAQKGI